MEQILLGLPHQTGNSGGGGGSGSEEDQRLQWGKKKHVKTSPDLLFNKISP